MSAMLSDTSFPLYVFEKDDWSMFLVEREEKLLYHIEPIDFENDEYLFWDAQGRGISVSDAYTDARPRPTLEPHEPVTECNREFFTS
jgi:hypothetical protein